MLQNRRVKRRRVQAQDQKPSEVDNNQAKNEMQEQRNKQEDEHIQYDATRHEAVVPAYVLEDHQLEMPTDTLAALLLLRAQFPVTQAWHIPIMLRTQVYSLVMDRTLVDRELDTLRHDNKIRMIRLPFGADHYCYVLTADYVAALHRAAVEREEGGTAAAVTQVYRWFADRVLPKCPDVTISAPRLEELLGKNKTRGDITVTDAHISLLLNSGFLARDASDREGYVFGLGNMGPVLIAILKGRKELLGFLSRRRFSQILVKELDKKKMVSSTLGTRFHVRDLLGSGSIIELHTTSGPLLRIAKKG